MQHTNEWDAAVSPDRFLEWGLELTPGVAPYSAISAARSLVAHLFEFRCEETLFDQQPSHAKDLMLNTWSVHRRAKSSICEIYSRI